MGCLDHDEFRQALERSNIAREEIGRWATVVDRLLDGEGVDPSVIPYVDVSLVDVFDRPDGQSSATEFLMCIFPEIGILLVREKGLFKKDKIETQAIYYSDSPGLGFAASAREQNTGWGWYHVHGVLGSVPVFTFGWPWSASGRDDRRRPPIAMAERDRILAVLNRDG